MSKPTALHRFLLLGIALLLLLAELADIYTPLERLELAARDVMMRLGGARPPAAPIVIVAIDDFSFNWTGYQWPWPRAYLAQIVDRLNEAGARLVGVDVFLFEADPDPAGDDALAAALARPPFSVSVAHIFTDPLQDAVTLKLPRPAYRQALDGIGVTAFSFDDDAITRSIRAYQNYGDQVYYHWAFEVARLYLGVDAPSNPTPSSLAFNGQAVPLTGGNLLINYAGPGGVYPFYPAARVALGDIPAGAFRDKIVLIGATSESLKDTYPTPFATAAPMAGVEIVANAIETLLLGQYLRLTTPWAALLLIAAMAALAGLINRSPRPSLTVLWLGLGMAVYAGIVYLVFTRAGWLLPLTGPELMLFLGVVLPTLEQAVSQELEKRRVRSLFTRFISPEMVDQLLATQDINSLNKRANLTILFADIRGFTSLSEKLTPEEVVMLLNPYLAAMTDVILRRGGTVDKYEGDAIVAFFGEPLPCADHARRAASAALEMLAELDRLRAGWQSEGRLPGPFEIGVGLNSGEVFVGLVGSAQRVNYTVIGDNVNLAARLQELSKTYAWPVIISESTAQAIQDEFEVEYLEDAALKGKSEPVKVYKMLGRKSVAIHDK
jgi:adenylate cyclase